MHKPNFKLSFRGELAEMLFGDSMEAMKGANRPAARIGPGHTTVWTHHNYITDPRGKYTGEKLRAIRREQTARALGSATAEAAE